MSRLIKKSKVVDKGRPSGDFLKSEEAYLILEDGMKFAGKVPHRQSGSAAGEVVFNTGMTGYVESLTDPSYSEQILTFTYPLIGNYGVPGEPWESDKIYAKGVVVSEDIEAWSHPLSRESLLQWLKEQNVPLIYDVDTRQLTRHLRAK
ncbi:MAG TPA: carbamoyl-phosphate synthase domain-containing protein, partial [Candidatus Saccharimonadales bacterium]|nr:carbamoyl-phosphate synthase domain-containing protein [Candidatus Saccharimonadales bacterium]